MKVYEIQYFLNNNMGKYVCALCVGRLKVYEIQYFLTHRHTLMRNYIPIIIWVKYVCALCVCVGRLRE